MTNVTMLVHNRPRLTRQSLISLGKIDHRTMRVAVLNDASDDYDTVEFLKHWTSSSLSGGAWLEWKTESHGTGRARNAVIGASERVFGRGDYLYLSDNDVYFKPGWLEKLIACYEAVWGYGCRVIGGVGHPYHQPYEGIVKVGDYGVHAVHAQPLQSMLMRWEVWDKYGPFCQTPPGKVCQSEDVDFTNKIKADGFKIGVVSPALIVNTGITNSFGEKIPGFELVKSQVPPGVIAE